MPNLPAITVLMLAVGTRAQKYAPYLAIALVVAGIVLGAGRARTAGRSGLMR